MLFNRHKRFSCHFLLCISMLIKISVDRFYNSYIQIFFFVYFWRARVYWPLLYFCHHLVLKNIINIFIMIILKFLPPYKNNFDSFVFAKMFITVKTFLKNLVAKNFRLLVKLSQKNEMALGNFLFWIFCMLKKIFWEYLWSNSRVRQVEGKPAPGAGSMQMQIYFQKLLFNFIQMLLFHHVQKLFSSISSGWFFIYFQSCFCIFVQTLLFIFTQKLPFHQYSEADFLSIKKDAFYGMFRQRSVCTA